MDNDKKILLHLYNKSEGLLQKEIALENNITIEDTKVSLNVLQNRGLVKAIELEEDFIPYYITLLGRKEAKRIIYNSNSLISSDYSKQSKVYKLRKKN